MTKRANYVLSSVVVLLVAAFFIAPKNPCSIKKIQEKVIGSSLQGLIENGTVVNLLSGYYRCNPVRRGDVVAYQAGEAGLIIKIVQAIPGDTWAVVETPRGMSIAVNGFVLKNVSGMEYRFDERAIQMLKLYIRDFKGVIPPESYFVLGTAATGAYDSTQTGLVSMQDIVGKIEF